MYIALHPLRDEPMRIEAYYKEFGRCLVRKNDCRPKARCPFCGVTFEERASNRENQTGHFCHPRGSGYCPSKEKTAKLYLNLGSTPPDYAHGQRIKAAFWAHWKWHYKQVSGMVDYLSAKEFVSLVETANERRIWMYASLKEEEIPTILVLLTDFTPEDGICIKKGTVPLRKHWFRFWYDASVRSLGDLWTQRRSPATLFCASYTPPRRKGALPAIKNMVEFHPIERDFRFLGKPEPSITSEYVLRSVPHALECILG